MLEHGGRLRAAAARYGIPLANWVDLSTGINPRIYPVPTIHGTDWQRLPEDEDALEAIAHTYYRTPYLLPVPGSQSAIMALPRLRTSSRVAILKPTYSEHTASWATAGHDVRQILSTDLEHAANYCDVLIVGQPNNPTGECFEPYRLLALATQLAKRNAWLIVDEAFVDTTPQLSLTAYAGEPGLIVLRSLGKFFGLAGARVGFVLAEPTVLKRMQAHLGPWSVAGPSRIAACAALADTDWQAATQQWLHSHSIRLAELLQHTGFDTPQGTSLFQWVRSENAITIQDALARRGILVRAFNEPSSLRFGLPSTEEAWQRLETALRKTHQSRGHLSCLQIENSNSMSLLL